MSQPEKVKVAIDGGTFALCVWLWLIALGLWRIAGALEQILGKMK